MEHQTLQDLVDQGLSLVQIAAHQDRSQGSIRYWIKKHGLRTRRGPHGKLPEDMHVFRCTCGETDSAKFYGHKRSVCSACHNEYSRRLETERREYALDKLGRRCALCGFDTYTCSLDFHHTEPDKKDQAFSGMRKWSKSRIDKELRHCTLLCKNCHAALHAGHLSLEDTGE